MNELQPKLQELRKRYKQDPTKQSKELLALYQKHHVNPFTNIVLMLIQFPILIALFQVFRNGLDPATAPQFLYSFVSFPALKMTFLGLLDLSRPSFVLALLTALAQFFQTKMSFGKASPQKSKARSSNLTQKAMLYFLPFITFMFLTNLNAAIGLYWMTTTVFSIGQQYLMDHPLRFNNKNRFLLEK
jgi:YidC/Oxa1 family membrane protein insertase